MTIIQIKIDITNNYLVKNIAEEMEPIPNLCNSNPPLG